MCVAISVAEFVGHVELFGPCNTVRVGDLRGCGEVAPVSIRS